MSSLTNTPKSMVGIVGLGAIGGTIAKHLLDRQIVVSALSRGSMEAFIREGGTGCPDVEALARSSPVLLLALPNGESLTSVFQDERFLSMLGSDHVIVSLGTYSLRIKEQVRRVAAERGATMLDCEVSGTPQMLATRKASVFASGDEAAFQKIRFVLDACAEQVAFLGEFGAATAMKLLAQQLVAIHTAAAAETIALGTRYGLDAETIVRVLSASAAGSAMLSVRGPNMAKEDFDSRGGTVASFLKSLEPVRQLAVDTHAATPLLEIAEACYKQAIELGCGEADISSVFRVFSERTNSNEIRSCMPRGCMGCPDG